MAWANDNTEVIAFAIEDPGFAVGIPSPGSADTIAPAVTKGNTTLLDTYGADQEDTLVVEESREPKAFFERPASDRVRQFLRTFEY